VLNNNKNNYYRNGLLLMQNDQKIRCHNQPAEGSQQAHQPIQSICAHSMSTKQAKQARRIILKFEHHANNREVLDPRQTKICKFAEKKMIE
jgi:hypothetical protein